MRGARSGWILSTMYSSPPLGWKDGSYYRRKTIHKCFRPVGERNEWPEETAAHAFKESESAQSWSIFFLMSSWEIGIAEAIEMWQLKRFYKILQRRQVIITWLGYFQVHRVARDTRLTLSSWSIEKDRLGLRESHFGSGSRTINAISCKSTTNLRKSGAKGKRIFLWILQWMSNCCWSMHVICTSQLILVFCITFTNIRNQKSIMMFSSYARAG